MLCYCIYETKDVSINKMSFRRKPLTVWDNNFWLDVNYLHIAKAALYCSAHFSTVLYAEIWCNCHRCVWLSLVGIL